LVENALDGRGVHAGACVRHRQPAVAPRLKVRTLRRVGGIHVGVARLDAEAAASWHRVARVQRHVHQDLLELAAVGLDPPQVRLGGDDQLDLLAKGPAQQLSGALDHLVHVEYLRIGRLAPREGQELAGHPDRLLGRCPYLLDIGEHGLDPVVIGRDGRELLRGEVGVARDHVEQVVEIMRDTADELAEALKPPRLLQPLLQALLLRRGPQALALGLHRQPLGNVPDGGDDECPLVRGQQAQPDLGRERGAIPAQPGRLHLPLPAGRP
jgi:hypothetical protein